MGAEVSILALKAFLQDLTDVCHKHGAEFYCPGTFTFKENNDFESLEVDGEVAICYWNRIKSEVVVKRSNEIDDI